MPRIFRKTVATSPEEHGCTAREIADQLGHAHVTTTRNHRFGRGDVRHDMTAALGNNRAGQNIGQASDSPISSETTGPTNKA